MLGDAINNSRLAIRDETRVTVLVGVNDVIISTALVRKLRTNDDVIVLAKVILRVTSRKHLNLSIVFF